MKRRLYALLLVLLTAACREECGPYAQARCAQAEDATFNVQFEYPNNRREYFLGQVHGLKACRTLARAHAVEMQVIESRWSYSCCMVAKGSSCLERHR